MFEIEPLVSIHFPATFLAPQCPHRESGDELNVTKTPKPPFFSFAKIPFPALFPLLVLSSPVVHLYLGA